MKWCSAKASSKEDRKLPNVTPVRTVAVSVARIPRDIGTRIGVKGQGKILLLIRSRPKVLQDFGIVAVCAAAQRRPTHCPGSRWREALRWLGVPRPIHRPLKTDTRSVVSIKSCFTERRKTQRHSGGVTAGDRDSIGVAQQTTLCPEFRHSVNPRRREIATVKLCPIVGRGSVDGPRRSRRRDVHRWHHPGCPTSRAEAQGKRHRDHSTFSRSFPAESALGSTSAGAATRAVCPHSTVRLPSQHRVRGARQVTAQALRPRNRWHRRPQRAEPRLFPNRRVVAGRGDSDARHLGVRRILLG